jgi:hypothetical protein
MTMKGTIKEITAKLNENAETAVSPANVNGFVKVLEHLGKAKVVGKGPAPARGRAAKIYEVEV